MSDQRPPLRLGVFSYLQGEGTAAEIYRDTLEQFITADRVGINTVWVANYRMSTSKGLPSPWVFFTAVAERTQNIGFGTAIVTLPAEHPIKVAEDAAVLETLHPGRVNLGVGTGFTPDPVLEAMGFGGSDRRTLYDAKVEVLVRAIGGEPLTSAGETLYPPVPALRQRIWEAPSTVERVIDAARRGSGLLLSKVAIGAPDGETHPVQRLLVDAYKANLPEGVAPRIGLSRTIYTSNRPDDAFRQLEIGLVRALKMRRDKGIEIPERTTLEQLVSDNIHWGEPAKVAESLRAEPLFDEVTDIIGQFQPSLPSQQEALESIELFGTKVGPALGWQPAVDLFGV